jgi:hypothetical protein
MPRESLTAENIQRNKLVLTSLGFETIDAPSTSSFPPPAAMLFVFVLSFSLSLCLSLTLTHFGVHLIPVGAGVQPVGIRSHEGNKRPSTSAPSIQVLVQPVLLARSSEEASPTARGVRLAKRAKAVRTQHEMNSTMKRTRMEWLQWGKSSSQHQIK